jgi:glycosyltransferase involved in cell wall biosynthesis
MQGVALVLAESAGGIGRHVLALVRALVGRGAGVRVYAPEAALGRYAFGEAGAQVTAVEISATPGTRDLGAIGQLRRALRSEPADVVHAHGLRAGLVASLARPDGVPLVVTWHTTFVAAGVRRIAHSVLATMVARAADLTLGVSADLVRRATTLGAREAWLSPVAAPVLAPPVRGRMEVAEEFGLDPATPIILAVGRLYPKKRHDLLIDAAARWRDLRPMPAVLLAGTGPAYRDLVRQAAMARAPIQFIGHRDDVADLLAAADLAVVTSDEEKSPLFVQEALTAGVPLVATAVDGLVDLVGDAAVLVPPGDSEPIDAAVRALLVDPDRRAVIGAAGRARAATWPTERQSVDDVIAAYHELAGRTAG